MQKKNKPFLKLPTYPGGSKALKDFILANLKYPAEALENKIQGSVFVAYEVNDNGNVNNAYIVRGIGSGCDEEALRLVNLLKYTKVKNIGQRVKSSMKISINFNLTAAHKTQTSYQYNYTQTSKDEKPKTNTYTYTLNINTGERND